MKKWYVIIILAVLGGIVAFLFRSLLMAVFTNPTKMSAKGRAWLLADEGFKNKAYRDTRGYRTIGVGHLIDVNKEKHLLTATLTKKQVEDLFERDLSKFEKAVSSGVDVPISQTQFDSLVSFAYNVGEYGFKGSTLLKKINSNAPTAQIQSGFKLWKSADNMHLLRRTIESMLWTDGIYQERYALSKKPNLTSIVNKYLA